MASDHNILLAWSRGTAYLATLTPNRLSTAQLLIFALAATCDRAGQPATFSTIREALGDVAGGSVKTTYTIFFKATASRPDGLGWLDREACPLDARIKYLRLSPKGRGVIENMLKAIGSPSAFLSPPFSAPQSCFSN